MVQSTELSLFQTQDYLLAISRALSEHLDIESVLRLVLQAATTLTQAEAGLIALYMPDNQVRIVAASGMTLETARQFHSLLQSMFTTGRTQQADWHHPGFRRALLRVARRHGLPFSEVIAMPFEDEGKPIGVLLAFRAAGKVGFTRYELRLLGNFADQAAIAIRNALLVQQLVQQRERMAAILANIADGIVLLNEQSQVELVNPAFAALSGWSPQRVIGLYASQVLVLVNDAGMPLSIPALTGRAARQEGHLIRADGTKGPYVSVIYTPLRMGMGTENKQFGTVVSVHDLSERHQLEAAKRAFIAGVSHELKTPLTIIIGYAETLLRTDAEWDAETIRQGLETIRDEAVHLTRLVDNLLDTARIEAGGLTLALEPLQLESLLGSVVDAFRAAHPDHRFVYEPPDEPLPAIYGDQDRLRQVIHNLLSNAVKYSPPDTTVRVEVWANDQEVGFCVSDEGPGIPRDQQPLIFERFYRRHETAGRTDGAGLGLYMAKALVEAHGGRIWVRSEEGQGATFCVALPQYTEELVRQAQGTRSASHRKESER